MGRCGESQPEWISKRRVRTATHRPTCEQDACSHLPNCKYAVFFSWQSISTSSQTPSLRTSTKQALRVKKSDKIRELESHLPFFVQVLAMPVMSHRWSIAPMSSANVGELFTAGGAFFALRNDISGTVHLLAFLGVGVGLSILPFSASMTWKPKYRSFQTAYKTSFEHINNKAAILVTGGIAYGPSQPSASIAQLKVMTGLVPWGKVLFSRWIGDAALYSRVDEGISVPNLSVERQVGYVKVFETWNDALDPPVVPDGAIRPDPGYIDIPDAPLPPAPRPPRPKRIRFEAEVLFDFDSDHLKPEAHSMLIKVLTELENRVVPRVVIEGHADSLGSDAYNINLSRRRAESVKRWFVMAHAPDAINYQVRGMGEAYPIADNSSAAGRARNRRVEIAIS